MNMNMIGLYIRFHHSAIMYCFNFETSPFDKSKMNLHPASLFQPKFSHYDGHGPMPFSYSNSCNKYKTNSSCPSTLQAPPHVICSLSLVVQTHCNRSLAVGRGKQGEVAGGALEGSLSELEVHSPPPTEIECSILYFCITVLSSLHFYFEYRTLNISYPFL